MRLLETHQEVAVETRPRLVVPMFVGGLVNFVGLSGAGMQALRQGVRWVIGGEYLRRERGAMGRSAGRASVTVPVRGDLDRA